MENDEVTEDVNGAYGKPGKYQMISRWLGPWLEQLRQTGDGEAYRVILSELEELKTGVAAEQHHQNLNRLNCHLCMASTVCDRFEVIFSEKSNFSDQIDEANRTILDKLAEVRAIVGLHRLGFQNVQFVKTPDFLAESGGKLFHVEVSRRGSSRMCPVAEALNQIQIKVIDGVGLENTLSDAIYHKIEQKYAQCKKSKHKADGAIVWVSLGRDYLTAGEYEPDCAGLEVAMPKALGKALDIAANQIRDTGSYVSLSRVVLSPGRDRVDLMWPEVRLERDSQLTDPNVP